MFGNSEAGPSRHDIILQQIEHGKKSSGLYTLMPFVAMTPPENPQEQLQQGEDEEDEEEDVDTVVVSQSTRTYPTLHTLPAEPKQSVGGRNQATPPRHAEREEWNTLWKRSASLRAWRSMHSDGGTGRNNALGNTSKKPGPARAMVSDHRFEIPSLCRLKRAHIVPSPRMHFLFSPNPV